MNKLIALIGINILLSGCSTLSHKTYIHPIESNGWTKFEYKAEYNCPGYVVFAYGDLPRIVNFHMVGIPFIPLIPIPNVGAYGLGLSLLTQNDSFEQWSTCPVIESDGKKFYHTGGSIERGPVYSATCQYEIKTYKKEFSITFENGEQFCSIPELYFKPVEEGWQYRPLFPWY